jgi:hypothetical protein
MAWSMTQSKNIYLFSCAAIQTTADMIMTWATTDFSVFSEHVRQAANQNCIVLNPLLFLIFCMPLINTYLAPYYVALYFMSLVYCHFVAKYFERLNKNRLDALKKEA